MILECGAEAEDDEAEALEADAEAEAEDDNDADDAEAAVASAFDFASELMPNDCLMISSNLFVLLENVKRPDPALGK